jgi:hypothetical protein
LIALLPQTDITSLLGTVGVFRIISLSAEIIGALIASLPKSTQFSSH